ncbi:hypothetical protein [Roseimicrobium sp. ORNL1]|uniref:hypothetical protein n=1 Tax=Roseimicrobium sp. ORNL1 TaxID=2711231 RepID=UPI0013E112FA|nr:hypothetical protein [Roseimicrobium sp. ORNL1]QIF02447.1 hypothetical protein G5S37_13235 [Roseimicrobium sp. ORNL1]
MKEHFRFNSSIWSVQAAVLGGLVCFGGLLQDGRAADCSGDQVIPPADGSAHVEDIPAQVIMEVQNSSSYEGCIAGAFTINDDNFDFVDYVTSGQESEPVEDDSCASGYRVYAYDSVYSIGWYYYEGDVEMRDEDSDCPKCDEKPSVSVSGSIAAHSGPATNMSSATPCGCVPIWA